MDKKIQISGIKGVYLIQKQSGVSCSWGWKSDEDFFGGVLRVWLGEATRQHTSYYAILQHQDQF